MLTIYRWENAQGLHTVQDSSISLVHCGSTLPGSSVFHPVIASWFTKLTGKKARQILKGVNELFCFYVEETVIVHVALFYV